MVSFSVAITMRLPTEIGAARPDGAERVQRLALRSDVRGVAGKNRGQLLCTIARHS